MCHAVFPQLVSVSFKICSPGAGKGPEPIAEVDPWLSVPAFRQVWPYRCLRLIIWAPILVGFSRNVLTNKLIFSREKLGNRQLVLRKAIE